MICDSWVTGLTLRAFQLALEIFGEMSEWLKEHAWKVCIR